MSGRGVGRRAAIEQEFGKRTHVVHKKRMSSIREVSQLQVENGPNLAVQQTLSQQMRLTAPEIEDRKRLLGIDDHDTALLNSCRNHIHDRIDAIVEDFYEI